MTTEIKMGDVARLKMRSGVLNPHPVMIVELVIDADTSRRSGFAAGIHCVWYATDFRLQRAVFNPHLIEVADTTDYQI